MASAFLMQQMEWREALDDANITRDLEVLELQVNASKREVLDKCEQLLDQTKDYPQAVQQVRALMFIARFAADVQSRLDQMESADRGQ